MFLEKNIAIKSAPLPVPGKSEYPTIEGPIHIIDVINYQKEAVVRKTLINHNAGTITLFAFDKGQRLSEHTSPYDAFLHILEGTAEITISGKRFEANEGGIIVLPANHPHALNALSRFKMLLTMIRSVGPLQGKT